MLVPDILAVVAVAVAGHSLRSLEREGEGMQHHRLVADPPVPNSLPLQNRMLVQRKHAFCDQQQRTSEGLLELENCSRGFRVDLKHNVLAGIDRDPVGRTEGDSAAVSPLWKSFS